MVAIHRTLSPDGVGRVHGCCSTVADGLGLPATAIIRLASQDQQELWRESLVCFPIP
jgi:hypothetical protein